MDQAPFFGSYKRTYKQTTPLALNFFVFCLIYIATRSVCEFNNRQGTDNMGAAMFMQYHLHLPLVVFWDIVHQGVNEVLLALQLANFWPVILELLLVFRLPYGPWAGQKFWRDLQEASASAASTDLAASSEFQLWLGERLAEETGTGKPASNVWASKGIRPVCFFFC